MAKSSRSILVLALAAAAGLAAYLKRPVKQPAATGRWDPRDR